MEPHFVGMFFEKKEVVPPWGNLLKNQKNIKCSNIYCAASSWYVDLDLCQAKVPGSMGPVTRGSKFKFGVKKNVMVFWTVMEM